MGVYEGAPIPTKLEWLTDTGSGFLSAANRALYRRVRACYNGAVSLYRLCANRCLYVKFEGVQRA